MSAHSIIAPSASGRWAYCSGSPTLEAKYPEEESEPAREGTASHWIGSSVLSNGGAPAECNDFYGLTALNGVLIDQDMVDSAAIYVAAVLAVTGGTVAGLWVEQPVAIPRVNAECFGTPDAWWFDPSTGTLHIWDYKYGWGIVEAFENLQAICYYAGILDLLGLPDSTLRVHIHIVQPRPYHWQGHTRTWKVPATDLRPFVNRLHNAAAAAVGPSGTDVTYCSGMYCRYCTGRRACLSAQMAAGYAVDVATGSSPAELTAEELGIELAVLKRAAKAIEYRVTGLEAQGLALAKGGAIIPGQTIGHGSGSTVWTKPVGEVLALGDLLGKNLRKKETAITPKQAETLGIDKTTLKSYSEHRSGKARLVADDGNKARQIFGGTLA